MSDTPAAGKDVYAFLELFLNRFPEYSTQPFHIAAESYGGIYAPNFANVIYKENKNLALAPNSRVKHINLASVMLGNGLTDPDVQLGSVPDYACNGPYPIYDNPEGPECMALRAKVPTCQRLIKTCYQFKSRFTCVPANIYCNTQIFVPVIRASFLFVLLKVDSNYLAQQKLPTLTLMMSAPHATKKKMATYAMLRWAGSTPISTNPLSKPSWV